MSTNKIYHEKAEEALAELDSEKADKLFLELVMTIEEAVNKNQKDLANELQRLAKEIEAIGRVDESLRFKQRTCEVMLRRSMAERRRNLAPPLDPAKDPRALTQMIFVCFTRDPKTHAAFLHANGINLELRVLPDGSRWMRSRDSQLMLLIKHERLSGFLPAFIATARDEAAKYLQEEGHTLDKEEVFVNGKRIAVMKDKLGQRFLLAGAEILQNI